jgi:hypothetical protein
LKSKDPQAISQYNSKVKAELSKQDYFSCAQSILATPKVTWTTELEEEYNPLLSTFNFIRQEIKDKLWQLKMGRISWPP